MLPLDCEQAFDPAREEEFFSALPARPAVFQVEPWHKGAQPYLLRTADLRRRLDRKSTRLNSSHGYISYAVFCLKKKKSLLCCLSALPGSPPTFPSALIS